jgi:hypothetical protein
MIVDFDSLKILCDYFENKYATWDQLLSEFNFIKLEGKINEK